MNISAIILAAGEGKRMKSNHSKVTHEIFEKPIINYVLEAAKSADVAEITVIAGHLHDEVIKVVGNDINYAIQEEQLGTGHAVMCGIDYIPDSDIFVLSGDTPLITGETLKKLQETHQRDGNGVTLLSTMLDNPEGYGRIIRTASGKFEKITEHKDATEGEKMVKEVNAGLYIFKGDILKKALTQLKNDNAQHEYYLTDTIEIIMAMGMGVEALVAKDPSEFYGVNSRIQLAECTDILKKRINFSHMENGVTIVDPNNTYIGPDVTIGIDTIIYPSVTIMGKCKIGNETIITPGTYIKNSNIGNGTKIQSSYVTDSKIGNNVSMGPFAYIRPNCQIGDNVRVGDFVEVKNSIIGDNTKISHLTYVGDSDVGKNINFGCGTVTVNYDGKNKYRTTIEDDAFIGCNTNLIAPVTVEKGAYIAAGSTITRNIPSGNLAIARSRQENKEGFTKLFRNK